MTGDGIQPYLPFGESPPETADMGNPRRSLTTEPAEPCGPAKRSQVPTSLAAFSAAWDCNDAEAAMRKACDELRNRTNQCTAPYALTPMLDALSAVRADAKEAVGAHGRLHASDKGWTVYRRTDMPWRRIRFTEAHELGHILLYEKLALNRAWLDDLHSEATHPHVEKLCDLAATELLIPRDDLRRDLTNNGLEQLSDYHRLYDLYMTSHRTLLRRIAEVLPNAALSVWSWQTHRNGDNWRVRESYCQNAGDVYIPRGISRRHLHPDVIELALSAGAATSEGHLDVRHRRYIGSMTALYPSHRSQTELPMHGGRAVRDEHGSSVYILHHNLSCANTVSPIRRRGRAS